MKTMLWDINVIPNGAGQWIPYASSWSSTHESFGQLRAFHSFSPLVSPFNDTCRWSFVLVFCLFVCVFCCFVVCWFPVLQVSWNFSNPPRVLVLDDRQGLTASSAMQKKKPKKKNAPGWHRHITCGRQPYFSSLRSFCRWRPRQGRVLQWEEWKPRKRNEILKLGNLPLKSLFRCAPPIWSPDCPNGCRETTRVLRETQMRTGRHELTQSQRIYRRKPSNAT